MTLYKWDRTANNDATADSTINWSEGQAPSSINDSARAMMAATAKYRDDIAGAIVTTGSSTAYLVSSYQAFDTLAHLSGQMIAFTPHVTNTGACTLNIDSLTAKPLRTAPNAELPAGTIIQGTPYLALYNNADGAYYLHGFFGSPYSVPVAGSIEYWAPTAPNSSFVFPFGQAISRTTYATLFSLLGTTYGSGDGSTTFNIPDVRGRVVACLDNMGGSAASRLTSTYFGTAATAMGAVGGLESNTLSLSTIPTGITSTGTITVNPGSGGIVISPNGFAVGTSQFSTTGGGLFTGATSGGSWGSIGNLQGLAQTMTSNNTSGGAHINVQPTIIANRIMRII